MKRAICDNIKMSGIKVCFFFVALFVLTQSLPVPDVFFELKQTNNAQDDIVEMITPGSIKNPDVSGGVVFLNPPELCFAAVDEIDLKCVDHCTNKGYRLGLCFSGKCTCV